MEEEGVEKVEVLDFELLFLRLFEFKKPELLSGDILLFFCGEKTFKSFLIGEFSR